MDTQVIIVGAGSVGVTLAIDLGRRGVRCILLEQKDAPQFLPKMERCNACTMEIYRRMGLAQKIRDAGFPRDARMDVFIVTSLVELFVKAGVIPKTVPTASLIDASVRGDAAELTGK